MSSYQKQLESSALIGNRSSKAKTTKKRIKRYKQVLSLDVLSEPFDRLPSFSAYFRRYSVQNIILANIKYGFKRTILRATKTADLETYKLTESVLDNLLG